MQPLSELLLKYTVPGVRFAEQRRICAEEASAIMNYPLTSKNVKYKNEELIFSVPPVLKSALVLKQGELIQKLSARGVTVRSLK